MPPPTESNDPMLPSDLADARCPSPYLAQTTSFLAWSFDPSDARDAKRWTYGRGGDLVLVAELQTINDAQQLGEVAAS
jgi:hypothetical protein